MEFVLHRNIAIELSYAKNRAANKYLYNENKNSLLYKCLIKNYLQEKIILLHNYAAILFLAYNY